MHQYQYSYLISCNKNYKPFGKVLNLCWASVHLSNTMFAVYFRWVHILITVSECHQELVASVQKHILSLENGLVRPDVVVVLGEMCPSLVAQSYGWSVMAGHFKTFLCDAFIHSLFNSLFHQLIIISLIISLSVYYWFFFVQLVFRKNRWIQKTALSFLHCW